MAYRNKTFVSFASEDIRCYRLMCAWRENKRINFNFHDAHDLNTALDTSQPDTIRRRLRERLANTKQVVLLVGDDTRAIAARPSRFLHYEVEVIKRLGLPVEFANLNGSRRVQRNRLPLPLTDQYTMSVSFQPAIIKHALDGFVDGYASAKRTRSTPHFYKSVVYTRLGL
jgi:Thoeris protein ThsB, TIR-like domain